MRSTTLMLAGILAIALFVVGPGVRAQSHVLPKDPAEPVITLDYQGNRLRRIDDEPTLSILASGKVVMPQTYAHTRAYEGRISQAELQELLEFAIRENQFFDYDAATVEAKLSKLERQPLPVHLSTTVIGINADNRTKLVRCPALGHGPMVEETRRILAIKRRLDRLMAVVKLGGRAGLASLLALANKHASSGRGDQSLAAAPFTLEDLEAGGRRADGSIHARFLHRDGAVATRVTIDITADGEQHVTVAQDDL